VIRRIFLISLMLAVIVSVLSVSAVTLIRQNNSSEAFVFVSPSSANVRVNQTFEVSINVSGVSDLYGWEFKLSWNTSLLELANITQGSFLNSSKDTYFVPKNMSTDGYLLAGCTSLRNVAGVSGNGTLATVEFRAKALGSCTLNLHDTKLVNSAKQLLEHSEIDGTVTASGCVVVAVEYLDGYPRSGADVWEKNLNYMLGTTGGDGKVADYSGYLGSGLHWVKALFAGSQFGPDTAVIVDENGNGSTSITANYEVTPPALGILSPKNQTYDGRLVPLNFTVYDYSPISWMGYSLDGQANTTVTGNITLNVNEGSHNVVIYANDTYGNMGSSDTVYFSSLGGCVVVRVQYRDGNPRSDADVIKFDPPPDYYLGTTGEEGQTTSHILTPGEYAIRAYYPSGSSTQFGPDCYLFVNSNGDGSATITNDLLEITPPAISVLSPLNLTYFNSSVPLTFAVYDYSPISWIGYSLDKQANTTITGNTVISVEDGAHGIVVYASDTFGNMGSSQMVCFTVNSSLYEPWETSFIGLGGYPMVGFTSYDGKLYSTSNNNLYIYDGTGWNVLETPAYVTSLMPYENNLIIGGQGGLYSYDGSSFSLIFPVSTYIKALGVYNNTLYAGTFLDKPPALYYCNGSPENPANWHVDTGFSTILNFSGAFGSIDSFAVYNGNMYVASGMTVYCFDGAGWSVALSYEYAYAFLDMQVYNGKLYLATRDLNRIPLYMGGTGFSGVIIEFDGENWTTVLGHDYWIYSLEVYDGKLYVGTANRIYTYNGTAWDVSFYAENGAFYAISMITYNDKIYVGMGNGYIFADPAPAKAEQETITVPEFSSTAILAVFMALTMLAGALTRKNRSRRFS